MKRPFFLKLMNQDAAAGAAAPAASPAPQSAAPAPSGTDSGATPASVAAPGQGGEPPAQGGAPSPVAGGAVDPNWIEGLSDQEFIDYTEGRLIPPANGGTPEGEPPAAGEEGKDGAQATDQPVDLGDGITPEELAALPPRVQEAIRMGDEAAQLVDQHRAYLNPEFQTFLTATLTDPVIAARIEELKGGVTTPEFVTKIVTGDTILDKLIADKAIDTAVLGLDIDNEGVRGEMNKVVAAALEAHDRVYQVKHRLELREQETINHRQQTLGNLWHDLSNSVASLKSDKPIDSPEHPIEPFRNWLLDEHAAGKLSWEFIEENGQSLFAAYAAKNLGGVAKLADQPARTIRANLIARIDSAARAAATTAGTARAAAPVPQQGQFGVDVARFNTDPGYRDQVFSLAESTSNSAMIHYLGRLERGGN